MVYLKVGEKEEGGQRNGTWSALEHMCAGQRHISSNYLSSQLGDPGEPWYVPFCSMVGSNRTAAKPTQMWLLAKYVSQSNSFPFPSLDMWSGAKTSNNCSLFRTTQRFLTLL